MQERKSILYRSTHIVSHQRCSRIIGTARRQPRGVAVGPRAIGVWPTGLTTRHTAWPHDTAHITLLRFGGTREMDG